VIKIGPIYIGQPWHQHSISIHWFIWVRCTVCGVPGL